MKRVPVILCCLGLALPFVRGGADEPTRPMLEVPHATETPRLRAESDDPAWRGPEAGAELKPVSEEPIPMGGEKPFATRVEVRWDAEFLYVRFWCRASGAPWSPHGAERDALHSEGDVVEVFIDPAGDARQFVEVQVSPANGVFDKLYLLTGEPRSDAHGVLLGDILRRDQWEFTEWNWEGLRSATAEWRQGGAVVGWIADLALPAKPLLRRLNFKSYQAKMTLHAHFVRNACPPDTSAAAGRAFRSLSWAPIPLGRPHRAPAAMGELQLAP